MWKCIANSLDVAFVIFGFLTVAYFLLKICIGGPLNDLEIGMLRFTAGGFILQVVKRTLLDLMGIERS